MMIFRSFLFAAFLSLSFQSQSALVTSIDGIDIDSVLYTATFHDFNNNQSFNTLFDLNMNGIYGESSDGLLSFYDPSSIVAPIRTWENVLEQIAAFLGPVHHVDESSSPSDGFILAYFNSEGVPHGRYALSTDSDVSLPGDSLISGIQLPYANWVSYRAWVTFSPMASVPTPAMPLLLLAGMLAGIGVRSRKRLRTTHAS